jgi:hypothetical protein
METVPTEVNDDFKNEKLVEALDIGVFDSAFGAMLLTTALKRAVTNIIEN